MLMGGWRCAQYWSLLAACDVVVSTAKHEFFGVSVIEAVRATSVFCACAALTTLRATAQVSVGLLPVCPHRLSYPELLPHALLYVCRGLGTGNG